MNSAIQHEPLHIEQLETSHWPTTIQRPTYYRLVFIQTGRGELIINGKQLVYQTGDVFFLGPADKHSFKNIQKTSVYSLWFTGPYISSLMTTHVDLWPHIQAYRAPLSGTLIANPTEQRTLLLLVEILVMERQRLCPLLANPVVESLMKTILSLVDRHLAQHSISVSARSTTPSVFIQRIVAYINQHITEPGLLRMEKLADVFNYSASHLGALFKQQVGESIQQYIIRYKLKQVEARLSLSTMTISQIADEFGFSDVCHLNKLFKRYYQHTPTNYRRSTALF
ncbi:helix-turn-helix domain-containing protein [Spirosoma sp.]|uniref:helix-turn-helix domain-containing protein n=1 Tax=Spirosoma sp. TaxID=1899569 RepID=UPI003B3B01E3